MTQNDVVTPTLERLVDAVEFLLTFGKAPREALDSYRGVDHVSMKLALLVTGAVFVSTFLVWVLDRMDWKSDPQVTRKIFGQHVERFTRANFGKAAPLAATALIVLATIVIHGSAWAWTVVDELIHLSNAYLGGTILDSINASLAFSSFFIPICSLFTVVVGGLSRARPEWEYAATMIVTVVLGILFCIYYPLALSGVHPGTSYWQAVAAIIGGLAFILLLVIVTGRLLKVVH